MDGAALFSLLRPRASKVILALRPGLHRTLPRPSFFARQSDETLNPSPSTLDPKPETRNLLSLSHTHTLSLSPPPTPPLSLQRALTLQIASKVIAQLTKLIAQLIKTSNHSVD